MKRIISLLSLLLLLLCVQACGGVKRVTSVTGGVVRVNAQSQSAVSPLLLSVVEQGRGAVDSIRRPVLGEAEVDLVKRVPESPLMNFAADALLKMATECSGEAIDIALTNKGGLRSEISAGVVTFGDVYNVFPFENKLAVVTLSGEHLLQLCREIASVGGEAVSGLTIVMTSDGELVTASVAGEPIEPQRIYLVATSDYLSQGNDKMTALALAVDCRVYDDITIRDLMVRYIKELTAAGKKISASCDGRITIQD